MALLIVISIAVAIGAFAAGLLARQYYLERAELRLNPVYSNLYSSENAALPAPSSPRVVFFGDSRVAGWQPKPAWPGIELIWRGINGETTAQMVHRFSKDTLDLHPSAIVIQPGINDLVAGAALDRGGAVRDAVAANLRTMTTAAAGEGVRVYLLTIVRPARPSLWRLPVWSDSVYDLVSETNDAIRAMATDEIVIVDADRLLADGLSALPANFALDTLHFNEAVYEALNRELDEQIESIVHAVQ